MRAPDDRVSSLVAALPGGKRTAGVIAIVIAVAALGALLLAQGNGTPDPLTRQADDAPFYLEGSVIVLGPAAANGSRPEESNSTLQWWFQRPGVWHWQLDIETTAEEDPVTIIGVADGKDAYLYKSDTNTYTRVAARNYSAATLPISVILGPIDVPGLVEVWGAQGTDVRAGGASRHIGRDAQVIEYSPTWRSSGPGGDRSGGIGRIWIDDETGLVVRNLVDGGSTNQYVDARVTLLNLEPRFDASTFRFDPPNGATLVSEN